MLVSLRLGAPSQRGNGQRRTARSAAVPLWRKTVSDTDTDVPDVISIFESRRPLEERLYFRMVDNAAAESWDKEISNGRPAHAVYLISKLFETAQSSIKVLSGSLARYVERDGRRIWAYGDRRICDTTVDFLRKGGKLEILVEEELSGGMEHPMVVAIAAAGLLDRVEVLRLPPQEDKRRLPYHFLLCDDHAMRVETDTENTAAVANFNDSVFGNVLARYFDMMKGTAVQVAVTA